MNQIGRQSAWGPILLSIMISLMPAWVSAEEESEDTVELETFVAEEALEDDLGLLQTEPVESVFGFEKTILETPRSVSSISGEFIDQFNIRGINDIVNFVPGTFTTSFFGVAGSLDIRGTSAENFFRGVKRLNNEGNYPTPIGASDRIDIIRGPMSPIAGPGKVGGALNFVPKSARAETGQYLEKPTGELSVRRGSWEQNVVTAEIGGPVELFDRNGGYYVYAEVEDSDSFYNNNFFKNRIYQASFNYDLTSRTRIEMGAMYQEWRGHENGGWNRVTQDLVDNGTYITGQPLVNIDQTFGNGNGLIEEAEVDAFDASLPGLVSTGVPFTDGEVTCFTELVPFCFEGNFAPLDPANLTQALVDQLGLSLDPATVGTAQLDPRQVLIAQTDQYDTDVETIYFDIIHEFDNGLKVTNKSFYDAQEYINVDGYGFTKIADAFAFENQLIFEYTFEQDNFVANMQFSPSFRRTSAFYALDFSDEIFDRVDLTQGFNANSLQQVPSRVPDGAESWSNYWDSAYNQIGVAFLADITLFERLNILGGVRYDTVDIVVRQGDGDGPVILRTFDPNGENVQRGDDDGVSFTISGTYTTPFGIAPYITYAEQRSIISGSAGDVSAANVFGNTFLGESELIEVGIKADLFDGRVFTAFSYYEQERIAFNAQNPVNNQATESKGYEFELRALITDRISLIGTLSHIEVDVIQDSGVVFSYIGAANAPQVNPAAFYGGIIGGNQVVGTKTSRGGIPEDAYGLTGIFKITEKASIGISWSYIEEVESSVLGGIVLPDYHLVNITGRYETDRFRFGLYLNNVLDEEYFRGNFPSLYGNNAVLPERPFNFAMEAVYKF